LPFKKLEAILRQVSSVLKVKKTTRFSLAFVSPTVIRRLNREYRGYDKTTDVLSFPFKNSEILGEVLICLPVANKQAKEFKHSVQEEITVLLVHGLLHLFGFDHQKPKAAAKMFEFQKKILKKLKIVWTIPEYG
jgi:probable rRNA maturation factor